MIPTQCNLPAGKTSWRDWSIPFECDSFLLRDVLQSMKSDQANQDDIPFIIQLVENPKYDIPWINIFNGAVNLADHDCIHALLGRGMLPKDEAFVIGFTMGSTNRATTFEQKLYSFVAKYLYPGPYKFNDDDIQVFKDAAHLGYISDCVPLDTLNYADYTDMTLREIRENLGIERKLLLAYYEIEQRRYPNSIESQRLLLK